MLRVASFTYFNEHRPAGKTCRLYLDATKTFVFDVEGYPILTKKFKVPKPAVEYFAGFREMSIKDWGASPISWGDYENMLAHYWPDDVTPPEFEVGQYCPTREAVQNAVRRMPHVQSNSVTD